MRIGHGFDAHACVPGRRLILGGVNIPFDRGMAAHSDGDVVIHALCDALLGAAALGDIGRHFPDSDPELEGIDSRILLRKVFDMMREKGLSVVNADLTIVAQAPRLAPYADSMATNIAADLQIEPDCVNVKASTTEKLGFIGRSEGIAVFAVVLLN